MSDENLLLGLLRCRPFPTGDVRFEGEGIDVGGDGVGDAVAEDEGLQEAVAGQAVRPVQPRAGTLPAGVEVIDARHAVLVYLDAAAHVVAGGADGDHLLHRVDADADALLVDGGEVFDEVVLIDVATVQAHELDAVQLHLVVDGAGDDVAGGEAAARVVVVHEFRPVGPLQDGPFAADGFGNEEGLGVQPGIVEGRGVELDELHVLQVALGAVGHGDTVSRSDDGVGGGAVDLAVATGGQNGRPGEDLVDLPRFTVHHVAAVALDVGRQAGDDVAQVVLRQEVEGEVVFVDDEVVQRGRLGGEGALDLPPSQVLVVQDAVFGVAALAAQVVLLELVQVEARPPFDDFLHAGGPFLDDDADDVLVAQARPGVQRIGDVLFVVIGAVIPDGGHATLGVTRVAFPFVDLRQDVDLEFGTEEGQFNAGAEAGDAGADDEDVGGHWGDMLEDVRGSDFAGTLRGPVDYTKRLPSSR